MCACLLWGGSLSFSFFSLVLFLKKQVLLFFARTWEVEDFAVLGTPVPKKSFHYLGPSPMRPNEIWTGLDMEPPELARGCQQC